MREQRLSVGVVILERNGKFHLGILQVARQRNVIHISPHNDIKKRKENSKNVYTILLCIESNISNVKISGNRSGRADV